jgi:hypothetical protein
VRAGRKEAGLDGLSGTSLVGDLIQRAAGVLGVRVGAEVKLHCNSRLLRAGETLAESGVSARVVLEMCVGEGGGMPSGCFGFSEQRRVQLVEELRRAEGQLEEERRRHAEVEKQLREKQLQLQTDSEGRIEEERRRHAEVEKQLREKQLQLQTDSEGRA